MGNWFLLGRNLELATFDVPMGLLRLKSQVQHIGEFLIQQINHRAASLLAKVILRFVQFHFHKESPVSQLLVTVWRPKVMFDFTLSLQPVINRFINIIGCSPSEGEAVATQAEESGETIARCFNSGE